MVEIGRSHAEGDVGPQHWRIRGCLSCRRLLARGCTGSDGAPWPSHAGSPGRSDACGASLAERTCSTARPCLAAVNSPDQSVVSGAFDLIDQFEKHLANRGITGRRLHTSHAFHSPMMDPILETFTDRLRNIRLRAPQIPFLSNVTADWISPEQATDPAYWAKHLRSAVRFADCLSKLYEKPGSVLLEVGPGNVLTSLARQHPAKTAPVFASTRQAHDSSHDSAVLLAAV